MFSESEAYDRFMGRWSRKLAVAFLDFVKLGDQDRVLEIGSGTGSLSRAILERISGGSVTGIDPSPHFVEHVRATVSDDRATFHLGSADHIEQPDDYFDATLSMLVLNFVPDAPAAAREMARVTRSGGVVAAAVWDYVGEMQMLRFFWEEAARLDPELQRDDERHQRLSGEGDLAQLWRDVGFIDIESAPLQIEMRFDSFDDYWQPFLGGQGPAGAYVASLSDSARSSLADNLRVRLQSAHGEVRLTARSWAVKGFVANSTAGA
ncbi:MAG: class I SAM-dependent methyltransferase [Armatimonadota bacterium]|nr:class I SAM-dependent methyltransferase [Armatimonadota bacterium]